MWGIYPVELASELETGSRLPTGEYTPPDATQTQLNSTQHIQFSIFLPNPLAVVVSYLGIQYTQRDADNSQTLKLYYEM